MPTHMVVAELKLLPSDHPNTQQVAVLNGPYDISMAHAEIPTAGDGEVRVKIKWVGVCGSDIETYRGQRQPEFMSIPARLGHEVAGIIDQVGPNVIGLQIGDQVTCRYVWGAFAETITCKPFNVKVLPKNFPLLETSLIEILPGILHTAELSQINQTKNVLITGQGVSGLVLTQVIKLFSPKNLVVTDLKQRNLDLAKKYGASHTYLIPSADTPTMAMVGKDFPDGFDVVIPCLLDGDGMVDAIDCCAVGARLVMYGCIGMCHKPVDFFKVHRRRLEIYSTEPRRDIDMRRYFQEAVQLVLDGLVNTKEMITHTVPLSQVSQAFALRDDKSNNAIHVLVDCESHKTGT
jgi:threonine dehydrogenase-like Zn-dependent dehydrogenase